VKRTQGRIFPRCGESLTIAIGPIASVGEPGEHGKRAVHPIYPAFVTKLLEQGHRVLLFATNAPDRRSLMDLQRCLRPDTLARHGARLHVADGHRLEGLLTDLSVADCVVASRLHGIVLAHALGLPVLALANDRAAVAHMNELRQLHHCLELDGLGAGDLLTAFSALSRRLTESAAVIYGASELARRAVVAHYDHVLRGISHELAPLVLVRPRNVPAH
jgi:polysaccharide pyruvyl transferase WcaK-like protein